MFCELSAIDPSLLVSDFFWTADDLAGTFLQNPNIVGCIGHAVYCPGIEPDVTIVERCDTELTPFQVFVIDAGYFELTSLARLNIFRDLNHVVIVKI